MAKRIMGPENDPFYDMRDHPTRKGSDAGDGGTEVSTRPGHAHVHKRLTEADNARVLPAWTSKLAGVLAVLSFLSIWGAPMAIQLSGMPYERMEWTLACSFGCIFLFIGLAVAGTKSGLMPGLLFGSVGGIIAAVSLAFGLGGDVLREALLQKLVPFLLLSVFIVAGLGFLVVPPIIAGRKAAAHTLEVPATVCRKDMRVRRDSDGRRSRTWVLTWTYAAGGKERTYRSSVGRYPERRDVGSPGVLYLSPDDPDDVWEKPSASERFLLAALGLMFAGAGGFAMVAFLLS